MKTKPKVNACRDCGSSHGPCARCHRYNGWVNYETWCVNLWLTNEQSSDLYLGRIVREAWETSDDHPNYLTRKECAIETAADNVKEWVTEKYVPNLGATMAADMLGAAMSEVDWYEIAENHMDDNA